MTVDVENPGIKVVLKEAVKKYGWWKVGAALARQFLNPIFWVKFTGTVLRDSLSALTYSVAFRVVTRANYKKSA
jgi:hypothetical protein